MKLDFTKHQHMDHITTEDLIRLSQTETEDICDANFRWLQEINEKIDCCEVCHKRYQRYVEIQTFYPGDFAAFTPRKESALSDIAVLLQDKLVVFDAKVQEKISTWLAGAQNMLGSFEQASFRPALAGVTRGTQAREKDAEKIIPVPAGDGNFEFTLSQKIDVIFRVSRKTDDGQPVCLVITGINETVFSEVFSLVGLELPGFVSDNLDSPKIALEPGDYTFCVPTIEA